MNTYLESQLEEILSEDVDSVINREKSSFDQLVAPFGESIVLFGAGPTGRKALAGLRKLSIEPLAFADNNIALWNKSVDGLCVLPPQEAAQKFGQIAIFVVTINNSSGPRQQLLNLNCSKVVSYAYLFAREPELFLPYACLDLPYEIYQQADDIRKAFSLWANDYSSQEYLAQLRWRLFLDFDKLPTPISQAVREEEYFPNDIFSSFSNEVFVDCGAFDGDTIKRFLQRRKYCFGNIIALEPDPINYQKLQTYVSTLPDNIENRVAVLQVAVGSRKEKVRLQEIGTMASSVSTTGTLEVDCVPLDEVLADCLPTLIKMDLEGFELDAIAGASRVIEQASAVLAVTVYHCQDHLWRIPLLIQSLSDQYRFFLRPYAEEYWDVSCYAVPVSRLIV